MLKNVALHSVATALANIVFPELKWRKVSILWKLNISILHDTLIYLYELERKLPVPGGPYNKMPFHGVSLSLNINGYFIG